MSESAYSIKYSAICLDTGKCSIYLFFDYSETGDAIKQVITLNKQEYSFLITSVLFLLPTVWVSDFSSIHIFFYAYMRVSKKGKEHNPK